MRGWMCAWSCLAIGCAQADPAADAGWVGTLEERGDTTFVHTESGGVWGGTARLVEEVRIGALDGPEDYVFGQIFRMAEAPDGGIYVLDQQVPVLRRYSRDGALVATLGREGQGPGEYTWMSLGMGADSDGVLYMNDWGNGRINRFDASGEALPSWPITSSHFSTVPQPGFLVEGPGTVLQEIRIDGERAWLRIRDGQAVDTVRYGFAAVESPSGGPYRVQRYVSMQEAGDFVVGVSSEYRFEIRRGPALVRVSKTHLPLPVRPDEAADWTAAFEWMDRQEQYRPPPQPWLPDVMPPYRGLWLGADGRVWVHLNVESIPRDVVARDGAPPPVRWQQPEVYDVFESDGRFGGQVRFPDGFTPHVFGADEVWGVQSGDLDEQYVVRLRLETG